MKITLIIIILACIASVEIDLILPAFEIMQNEFSISTFEVELLVGFNLIAFAISSFFIGMLADRYGSRKIMIYGMVVFFLGSVITLLADAYMPILLGRFIQGLGVAAPFSLPYVILSNHFSLKKQRALIGVLNGFCAASIACAPVIGAYLTLYLGWKSNFVALLILSIVGILIATLLPCDKKLNEDAHISWKSYSKILSSAKAMYFIMLISCIGASYIVFVCMSPIFYMNDMGVPLAHFGFYQGTIAATFAFFSITSGYFFNKIGRERCFKIAGVMYMLSMLVFFFIGLFKLHNPILIVANGIIWSIAAVVPINYLWPFLTESVPSAKGKITSFFIIIRLLLTSLVLLIVSYFHRGEFISISLMLMFFLVLIVFSFYQLYKRDHITFEAEA